MQIRKRLVIDSSRQWFKLAESGDLMKTVSMKNLQKHLKKSLDAAQQHKVVITRKGKPAAILIGVEGEDWETVVLQTSAPFWKLIEKRRKQKTVLLREMKQALNKSSR